MVLLNDIAPLALCLLRLSHCLSVATNYSLPLHKLMLSKRMSGSQLETPYHLTIVVCGAKTSHRVPLAAMGDGRTIKDK